MKKIISILLIFALPSLLLSWIGQSTLNQYESVNLTDSIEFHLCNVEVKGNQFIIRGFYRNNTPHIVLYHEPSEDDMYMGMLYINIDDGHEQHSYQHNRIFHAQVDAINLSKQNSKSLRPMGISRFYMKLNANNFGLILKKGVPYTLQFHINSDFPVKSDQKYYFAPTKTYNYTFILD